MGWEYTQGATRQDIINAETKTQTVGAVTQTCLDKALNGARLWTVFEHHAKQAAGRHMAKSLMPGVTVRLGEAYGRRTFVIRERNKTKVYAAEVATGRMFQLPPKALQDAEIVTA